MEPFSRIDFYKKLAEKNRRNAARIRKQIYSNGTLRLIVFAVGVGGGYLLRHNGGVAAAIVLAAATVFAFLLKRHNRLTFARERAETTVQIAEDELKAFDCDYSAFDGAKEKIDPEHPFAFDLDLFGKNSLFQLLNRTALPAGKERLAQFLQQPLTSAAGIEERQQAIRELSAKEDFRIDFQAVGKMTAHAGIPPENIARKEPIFAESFFWKTALLFVPAVYLAAIALRIVGVLPETAIPGIYIATLLASTLPLKRIKKVLQSLDKKTKALESYALLLKKIEDTPFESERLKAIQNSLSGNRKASDAIFRLSQYSRNLDLSFLFPTLLLLNPLLLWNVLYTLKIERWMQQYAEETAKWFDALAEIDALISLATFAANRPGYTYPILSEIPVFKAKNMGHPLIRHEKCVPNDIDVSQKPFFMIVTGANMAGKSTYLRTVGVNHLLASVGAPVYAEACTLYPGNLLTNLRTADSLTNNESYFFAELKRLKRIIERLKSGEEGLFIVLDEILKGTNSEDKQKGSFALMKQLVKLGANGIIATHDLALGQLENEFPDKVKNFHFDASVSDDTLTFDYRLRQGIAQNMNASFLMRKMGIVE